MQSDSFQIFEYMLKELRKLSTNIAVRLEMALLERINERRLREVATLMAYLKNPQFLDRVSERSLILKYATRAEITKQAKELYMRLFHNAPEPSTDDDHHSDTG